MRGSYRRRLLGVPNARDLQPHQTALTRNTALSVGLAFEENLLRVLGSLRSEAADGLLRVDGLGRVHAYEQNRGGDALGENLHGVAVRYLGHRTVKGVGSSHPAQQAVEAHPEDRVEQERERQGEDDEDPLGVTSRHHAVLIAAGKTAMRRLGQKISTPPSVIMSARMCEP